MKQELDPGVFERPPGHGKQAAAPAVAEKVPVKHCAQLEEPAALNVPGGQMVQPAASIVPGFVAMPAKPESQIVHEETDAEPS